jgi:hypothetical protein
MQNQKYLEIIDKRMKELADKADRIVNSKEFNCHSTDRCNKYVIAYQYEGNYGDNTLSAIMRIIEE